MININLDTKAQKLIGKVAEDESDLIVNPELTDEEPDLTGIQYKGVKYKVPQGGGQGGKKTRTLALSGDIQCYGGYAQFIYESEDDTVSYSYDGEAEDNPILTHLMNELANGREIHGYGYWPQHDPEVYQPRHPLKMYIYTDGGYSRVMFEALDNSGFGTEIDHLVGCDVIND